jgi:hypothetical protein
MYGKIIESVGKNKYKVLFTNGVYHQLSSTQLTHAPKDASFEINHLQSDSNDLETVLKRAERNDDVSMLDNVAVFQENDKSRINHRYCFVNWCSRL